MWTREELKTKAKATMKKGYWKMFIVGLLLAFVNGGGGSSGGRGTSSIRNEANFTNVDISSGVEEGISEGSRFISEIPGMWAVLFTGMIGLIFVGILVAFALRIMLGYPLEVGCKKFFVDTTEHQFDLNKIGFSFKSNRYWDVVRTMLYKAVLIFLWSLLLIIPGIIKAYGYRMVPYILAENPSIGHWRALELSLAMTDGQKMDIFVLDLSFIGWYLLGTLAFGIGVVFVNPYVYGTNAELYRALKEQALYDNLCTPDEFVEEAAYEF